MSLLDGSGRRQRRSPGRRAAGTARAALPPVVVPGVVVPGVVVRRVVVRRVVLLLGLPALVLAGALQVPGVQQVSVGRPPRQIDSGTHVRGPQPAVRPVTGVRGMLGVAHNAGDRRATARRAVEHGADLVEIDVVRVGDALHAGHDRPWPLLGEATFRGPELPQAWRATAPAGVLLDLKAEPDGATADVARLAEFLRARVPDGTGGGEARRVLVTSRWPGIVARLGPLLPGPVTVLLTVADRAELARLRADPQLAGPIEGLSLQADLLDAGTARWAQDRGLLVLAWTVDDPERVRALARQGVDGVVTDDLAILRLLAGP